MEKNPSLLSAQDNSQLIDNTQALLSESLLPDMSLVQRKLDADEYSAQDGDASTEGLFSSGGMGYASLQASQTDASLRMQTDVALDGQSAAHTLPGYIPAAYGNNTENTALNTGNLSPKYDASSYDVSSIQTNRPLQPASPSGAVNNNSEFSANTVAPVTASQLSSGSGVFSPAGSGLQLSDGINNSAVINEPAATSPASGMNNTAPQPMQMMPKEMPMHEQGDSITNTTVNNSIISNITDNNDITIIDGDTELTLVTIDVTLQQIQQVLVTLNQTINNNITSNTTNIISKTLNVGGHAGDTIINLSDNIIEQLFTTINTTINEIGEVYNITYKLTNKLIGLPLDNVPHRVTGTVGDTLYELKGLIGKIGGAGHATIEQIKTGLVEKIDHSLETLDDVLMQTAGIVSHIINLVKGNGLAGHVGDKLETVLHTLTGEVNETPQITAEVLDTIYNIINHTVDNNLLQDLLHGHDGTDDVDLVVDAPVLGELDVTLDPVEAIAGDIDIIVNLDADSPAEAALNIVAEIEALDNLLGSNTDNDDVDLVVDAPVLGELDITLDPVEAIAGDIDITAEIGEGLLPEALPVSPLFDGTDYSNDETVADDTDIVIDADIELAGMDIVDIDAEIPLDTIEAITGDIDIDVIAAVELLDDDMGDELTGALDDWTESTVIDAGGLFGDIIAHDNATELPDPSGVVEEGLGALHIDSPLHSTGGLFG